MALDLVALGFVVGVTYLIGSSIYNLYFHPLAHVPGPFFARISSIPSFYHACKCDRHIWLWQNFQIYGHKVRTAPNTVMFDTVSANDTIFGPRANVMKSGFYEAWRRTTTDVNTLGERDVARHAKRRRRLAFAFTEKSTQSAGAYIIKHIDRWNEVLVEGKTDPDGWTEGMNMTQWANALTFDIMGELSFGIEFNTKEPEKPGTPNPYKSIPHLIEGYLEFMYPITKSPALEVILWLKPRGLNRVMQALAPPGIAKYYHFVTETVLSRAKTERNNEKSMAVTSDQRKDMFHYLSTARDPETGELALSLDDLVAESNLLVIAGSDTTSTVICSTFFFLTRNPSVLEKLYNEIRNTFDSIEEIKYGAKLSGCEYLKACIDESFRLGPPGVSELPRDVRKGGIEIDGDFYPEGTTVGLPYWAYYRSEETYGDASTFRPDRWIVSDAPGQSEEQVRTLKHAFTPFIKGVGSCIGKNIAMLELMATIARTLWRLEVRQMPGDKTGEGKDSLGWGRRNPNHYMMEDVYVSKRDGPVVQFRVRK